MKLWMSENRIEALSNASAIGSSGCSRSRATIVAGRILWSSASVAASARSVRRNE